MKKDIRLHYALSILLMMIFSIGSAQNFGPNQNKLDWNEPYFDLQETNRDSLVQWQEHIVLHIANEHANKDNLVFFKGYLITGVQQNRYSPSNVLNIELLDVTGAVIKRQFHRIADGMVVGNLELPKNTKPGKYYVRAYTRWMQNYGEDLYAKRQIWIGESLGETTDIGNKSDILIFPEGGTLLSGHENRVVVKMHHNKEGKVGRILDDKNNEVAIVNNYSTCMGTAIYKPIKDREYRLELENGSIYPIPRALNQGYLLHVNNLDAKSVKIRVTASSEVAGTAVKLVGIFGGIRYFEKQLDFKDSNIAAVEFSKKGIPNGTLFLKLMDEVGTEYASRPILVDAERIHIDISPIASDTGESTYKIRVTDKNNLPVKAQVAVSAKNFDPGYEITFGNNSIGCSDLFTFPEIAIGDNNSTDRKHRFLLDLNVLLSEIELNNNPSNGSHLENGIKFPIQKGLELTGYAYDLDNKLLSNTEIQIIALNEDEMWFEETETDANGLLKLDELQIIGNTTLVFRTKGKDPKSRLVKVKLTKDWEQEKAKSIAKSAKKQERIRTTPTTPQQLMDPKGLIELEEVEVSENKIKERKSMPSMYGIDVPKMRIKYQNPRAPRSIAQMISEVPGVVVKGIGNFYPSVTIPRGSGAVLWVLDGFPLAQGDNGPSLGGAVGSSLRDIMDLVSAVDVERIELLIGADAAIYGSRGSGGVIAIYTRSGGESKFLSRKEAQLVYQGYEPILEFELYQQSLSKRAREKSNILYWNPKLETDENGEAIFRIPTSSQESVIQIEASTITPDGKIGSLSTNF